ncbi:MAG: helix-turn-helix domain-containing protein [Rhizobium sp.]|nr:helix-turn-helix domain-containing protein [Rhizobium sp.]
MVDSSPSIPLPQRLGRNIAAARKAQGWTQATLAERVGMEPESISRIERGATLPSLAVLERLAALLRTSVADLLAEYPGSAYSESQRIAALLDRLEPQARADVLDLVGRLCELLRARAG